METFCIPFTGGNTKTKEIKKEHQKFAAETSGVHTAAYEVGYDISVYDLALKNLRFPMLIKDPIGENSIGMTKDSKILNP